MPRSNQKLTFSELRVGIFMFAALVVTGFLILNSSGDFNPFEKRMRLKARFVSADGLRAGGDVQLAGVKIGKVEEVVFLPPDAPNGERVEATFLVVQQLDKKPITELIRTDSTAQLVATSILANDKMINIVPGTTKGQPVGDNAVLASTASASLNQLTSTGNDLLTQINKLAIPANEILQKANNGQGTLGRIVNDEALYESLNATINEAKNTIEKINSGKGTAGKLVNDPALYDSLNKTVANLESIAADVKNGRGTAGKFVNDDALYNDARDAIADLRKSAAKINEIADDVKSITVDLKDGKGSAGKLLKDEKLYEDARTAIEKFNSMSTRLDAILADAQAGKGTLGKFVTDETLYNSINQTASNVNQFTSEGTKLLYDFRQNPKKFLRIKLALF
ncbi:MAG TPA: MlaD family protein [Pyrinomonadaceae bacterium]|nr:MlaD family protein [Pyrinomonadaceae bacterium]